MKLYLSKGSTWTGTQADAKEAQGGKDYAEVEVPTSKPELIAWLNDQWALLLSEKQGVSPAAGPDTAGDFEADPERYDAESALMKPNGDPLHDRPYQNGMPTQVYLKSRNPAAVTTCLICGRDERAQKLAKARSTDE